jgi:hypothetical protein
LKREFDSFHFNTLRQLFQWSELAPIIMML